MRIPGWLLLAGVLAGLALTVVGAYAAYAGVRQFTLDTYSLIVLPDLPQLSDLGAATRTPAPTTSPGPDATEPAGEANSPDATDEPDAGARAAGGAATPQPWDDPTRVTILVLGIDQRQGEQGPFRTDTVMLLSMDPIRKTAAMLSIPRDLNVQVPGFATERINTANAIGEANEYPGGGAALAVRTVEANFGLDVDFYVLINFDVFTALVDALGAVEVCPPEAIDDDKYPDGSYGIISIHFDAGCQELDSTRLLQYARTRATFGGDFDRAARQQEVIQAIRGKLMSLGGVSALLSQAPAIWESIRDNVQTDLTLDDIIRLALLAQDIPKENIRQGLIDAGMVETATRPDGQQVLLPISYDIRLLIQELLRPPEPVLTAEQLELRSRAEGAILSVVNGTATRGLATAVTNYLTALNYNVGEVGNAVSADYAQTVIRDYTGNPYTAKRLAQALGLPESRISAGDDGATRLDIQVAVGADINAERLAELYAAAGLPTPSPTSSPG